MITVILVCVAAAGAVTALGALGALLGVCFTVALLQTRGVLPDLPQDARRPWRQRLPRRRRTAAAAPDTES
jgi:hypothetical protein